MKKASYWILGILGALLIGGFMLPNKTVIQRTATIEAPIEKVQALLSDLSTYDKWMTYNQKDPNWKKEISTPSSGAGASYSWTSEKSEVGSGKMTLVKCTPNAVECVMDFGTNGVSQGKWELSNTKDNKTEVKWSMTSEAGANPLNRYRGLLATFWVGSEFEKSLQQLNQVAKAK